MQAFSDKKFKIFNNKKSNLLTILKREQGSILETALKLW